MTNLDVRVNLSCLKDALSIIYNGNDRPNYYSVDEDGQRLPLPSITDWPAIIGPAGCFFWGEKSVFDIRISPEKIVIVFVESEDVSVIEGLAENFSNLPLLFGYACDENERSHRNKISRKMSYGVHEAWVGRDYNRYLPGIYWITIIPMTILEKFEIDLESLREISENLDVRACRNCLIRLYEKPGEWVDKVNLIDGWCSKTMNCFSKKLAEAELADAQNFLDAAAVIEKWK